MSVSTAAVVAVMASPIAGMQLQAQIRSAVQAELESQTTGYGHSECACIGISGGKGTVNVTIGDALVEYPSDVGSRCEAWDNGRYPSKCEDGGKPGKGNGFCGQKWCYVDPCSCEGGSPKKTTYTLDAAYKGKPLYYSYDTCGSDDTYTEAVAVEGAAPKKTKVHKTSKPKEVKAAPKAQSKDSTAKETSVEAGKPEKQDESKEKARPHNAEQNHVPAPQKDNAPADHIDQKQEEKEKPHKAEHKDAPAPKQEAPATASAPAPASDAAAGPADQASVSAPKAEKTWKAPKANDGKQPASASSSDPAAQASGYSPKAEKTQKDSKAKDGNQWKPKEEVTANQNDQGTHKKQAPHQDTKVAKEVKPSATWSKSEDELPEKPSKKNDVKKTTGSKEKPVAQQTGSESAAPSASKDSHHADEVQGEVSDAVSNQDAPAKEVVSDADGQKSDSETSEAQDESEGVVEKAKKILGIDRSDESEEKETEDSSADDSVQAAVEVDVQETEIEMQAMCASPVDEKLVGKNGCACIGISNQPGFMQVKIGDTSVSYPAEVGGSCAAWDKDTHPECISEEGGAVPDWCQESWCYVDPCSCNQKAQMSGKKHGYISKGNFEGRPLYYSYKACGSVDLWSAKNNEEACMNKEQESDCSGDCVWTGKKCADKVLTTVCAAQQSGAVSLRATVSLLLGAVAAVAFFV